MRNVPGYLDNPVRRGLWRAGHAHAGVLVLFSLVALLYVDQADLSDTWKSLVRASIVAAPILMPLGFFLSVARPGDTKPSKLIYLVMAGGAAWRWARSRSASGCSDSRAPLRCRSAMVRTSYGSLGDFRAEAVQARGSL